MNCYELVAAVAAENGFFETVLGQFVNVVKVPNGSVTPTEVILAMVMDEGLVELTAWNPVHMRNASWVVAPFMIEAAKFDLVQFHLDRLTKEVTE